MTEYKAFVYMEDLQMILTENRHLFRAAFIEANNIALTALEKQIAEAPAQGWNADHTYSWDECPACRYGRVFDDENYCKKCGQKLDWSGKNTPKQ